MNIKMLTDKDQLVKGNEVTVSDDIGKALLKEKAAKLINEKKVKPKTEE